MLQNHAEVFPPRTPDSPKEPSTPKHGLPSAALIAQPEFVLLTSTTTVEDSRSRPPKKNRVGRILVALGLLIFVPTSLAIAIAFFGKDRHHSTDRFPQNESGVGFLSVTVGQDSSTQWPHPSGGDHRRCLPVSFAGHTRTIRKMVRRWIWGRQAANRGWKSHKVSTLRQSCGCIHERVGTNPVFPLGTAPKTHQRVTPNLFVRSNPLPDNRGWREDRVRHSESPTPMIVTDLCFCSGSWTLFPSTWTTRWKRATSGASHLTTMVLQCSFSPSRRPRTSPVLVGVFGVGDAGPGDFSAFTTQSKTVPTRSNFTYDPGSGPVTVEVASLTTFAKIKHSTRAQALTLSMFIINWVLTGCSVTLASMVVIKGGMNDGVALLPITVILTIPAIRDLYVGSPSFGIYFGTHWGSAVLVPRIDAAL